MATPQTYRLASVCARETEDPRTTRPHVLPLYATSSFSFDSIDEGISIFSGEQQGHVYGRYGNPTMEAVARKLAQLEAAGTGRDAEGLLLSSGQAAISTLMLSLLQQGDKILTQGNLYGGTTELFQKVLAPHGIGTLFTDLQDTAAVEAMLQEDPTIRMLYFETPANPTLACVDIGMLSELARRYGAWSAVDNTFATPVLQQPLRYGVDFIIHSTTKFLNGHGNAISGAIITSHRDMLEPGGRIWTTMKLTGTNASPWDAWLLHNGMKTLALRMERHSANAMSLARHLENDPRVLRVNYCGLPSHPDHAVASRQMNAFGGMLSFELKGGLEAGLRCMNAVRFCTLAPTLGDVDTLILHPASMSHRNVAPSVRQANGITDGLIRVSCGIEDILDITEDLQQAMDAI
ncbi:MAG: hypothetical protein RLY31_2447 [Bacteroidota bacterium]|jgi:methionine-gamma-lyase